ncbi:hypothetical protein DPEC_G00101900 [Dallia pectoralis]|uniref:Uncharacterized protein n=1 Tax=Dallia pectoralis TaxID=75939 RepID=A0ACC2GWW7_DALPE|nr:hypothetical protein DPEC_G00101900 [Dallia pectoralis]
MVRKPQSPCSQVVKRILERGTTPVPRVEGLGLRREHKSLYLIVAFDEGASGPVAREWFTGKNDGGMAWWPPYKDSYKILQSILKRTLPNPSKGWKQYSCRILHETSCFESLSKRWGLSCHTSDLNTDKEELPADRQRRNVSKKKAVPPSHPSFNSCSPSHIIV